MELPAWQASLLDEGPPAFDGSFGSMSRRALDAESWIDFAPSWMRGSEELFADIVQRAPWQEQSVKMYDKLMAQPRLTAHRWDGMPSVLEDVRRVLSARYGVEFTSVGFNFYRDGRDSVAWHGDRVARTKPSATVCILSLGGSRRFLLRPKSGMGGHIGGKRRSSMAVTVSSGDLLVMGGACQRWWDHSVPKVKAADPRVSVTFRHEY